MKTIKLSGKLVTGKLVKKLYRSDLRLEGDWEIAVASIIFKNNGTLAISYLFNLLTNLYKENQWISIKGKNDEENVDQNESDAQYEETESIPLKSDAFILKPSEFTCRNYSLIWFPINSLNEYMEVTVVSAETGLTLKSANLFMSVTFFLRPSNGFSQ